MSRGEILAEMVLEGDQEFSDSMEEAGDSMDDAGDQAEDSADQMGEMEDSLWDVDRAGVAAGAAVASIGGGMESVLQDTQDMRSSLNQTAITMDISSDEANDLARSMQDATFPMEDVTATMGSLAEQGIESEEKMEELALQMDDIADATGQSAEAVADQMGPALRAMGEDLEDAGDHADTFTFIQQQTAADMEDFTSLLERHGSELDEMGMSIDDSAALLAAMEEEGMSADEAMRELRSEVNEGHESQEDLADALGVSEDAIQDQAKEIDNAEGLTEEYADAANETVTTTDRLRARFDDLAMQAGGLLGPIDALAPVLMSLGAAQSLVATINFGAVIPSIMGVMTALGPLLPILLLATAIIGGLALAWDNNWFSIQERTEQGVEVVHGLFERLKLLVSEGLEFITDLFLTFHPAGILWDHRDESIEAVRNMMDTGRDLVDQGLERATDLFLSYHPAGIMWDHRDEVVESVTDMMDSGRDLVDRGLDTIMDLLFGWTPWEPVDDAIDQVKRSLDISSAARSSGSSLMSSFASGIRSSISDAASAASDAVSSVRDRLPFSPAKEGPLKDLDETGPAFMQEIADGMSSEQSVVEDEAEQTASLMSPDPDSPDSPGGSQSRSRSVKKQVQEAMEEADRTDDLISAIKDLKRTLTDLEGDVLLEGEKVGRVLDQTASRQQHNWEVTE